MQGRSGSEGKRRILLEEGVMFRGMLPDNEYHRHFGIQLSFTQGNPISIHLQGGQLTGSFIYVGSSVSHKLVCLGPAIVFIVSPMSRAGRYLRSKYPGDAASIQEPWLKELSALAASDADPAQFDELLKSLPEVLTTEPDKRIAKAMEYLAQHPREIVPVEEMAAVCGLSNGRFLHLFKQETGISFRRYQIYNRLAYLGSILEGTEMSLTDAAHEAGFADSAHFSRAFRQTFGQSPREILK